MISKELVNILACPATQKPLMLISQELLKKINHKILKNKCYTVGKKNITVPLQAALYEPDSGLVYRIEDEIPVLLCEEAVDSKNL